MTALTTLRDRSANGTLEPALRKLLDSEDRYWRRDQASWWATHDTYRAWCDTHNGAAPDTWDNGAAGLRPWLLAQDDGELTARQRTALQTLPGWRGTIGDPAAAHAWGIVTAMHDAGVIPARADDAAIIDEQVDAARAAYTRDATYNAAASTRIDTTTDWEQDKALTYALFRARNLREPIAIEPGGNWIRRVRERGQTGGRLQSLITVVAGEAS